MRARTGLWEPWVSNHPRSPGLRRLACQPWRQRGISPMRIATTSYPPKFPRLGGYVVALGWTRREENPKRGARSVIGASNATRDMNQLVSSSLKSRKAEAERGDVRVVVVQRSRHANPAQAGHRHRPLVNGQRRALGVVRSHGFLFSYCGRRFGVRDTVQLRQRADQ